MTSFSKKVSTLGRNLNGLIERSTFYKLFFLHFLYGRKIRKLVKKGHSRHAILDQFRASNKFDLMRSIYEHRLFDNTGALKVRLRDFGHTFWVKFNNWWRDNKLELKMEKHNKVESLKYSFEFSKRLVKTERKIDVCSSRPPTNRAANASMSAMLF